LTAFIPAAPGHVLNDDLWPSRDVFFEKWNQGTRLHVTRAAGSSAAQDGNCFSLEIMTLGERSAAIGTKECGDQDKDEK
jgi:hypothetical protein